MTCHGPYLTAESLRMLTGRRPTTVYTTPQRQPSPEDREERLYDLDDGGYDGT